MRYWPRRRGGAISYYLDDGQGCVRLLVDGNGAITDSYTYDAFGNALTSQGSTVNPYRYTGQQFDSLIGLYDLRARYYDPTGGRFLSPDTAAIDFGNPVELDRYSYAQDNPITLVDPSGHDALQELGDILYQLRYYLLAGAVVGLVIAWDQDQIERALEDLADFLARLWAQVRARTIAVPIAVAVPATPTPSTGCPAESDEADYNKYSSVHGLVRGPSTDGGTQPCHVNAEVGYRFQPAPEQALTNLHIHYVGGGEYTSNGTPIGTCNDEFDCNAASVVSSVLGTILGKKALLKPSQEQKAIGQAVRWFYDELWSRLLALKNYPPGAWQGPPLPLPTT